LPGVREAAYCGEAFFPEGSSQALAAILAHHCRFDDRRICRKRMNGATMAPQGAGDGSAADLVLDAAEEQRWNEAQLAEPVTQPQMRVWTYRQGAIVLGRSQHAMAEQVASAGRAEGASACVTAAGSAGGAAGAELLVVVSAVMAHRALSKTEEAA